MAGDEGAMVNFAARGLKAGKRRTPIPPQLGPYLLGRRIGHGGMGVVYRATHTQLGVERAVKVLSAGTGVSTTDLRRFVLEARAVAGMGKHPHIVEVHDLDSEGTPPWFAMELAERGSLRQRLKRHRFTPEETAALLEKVARALHFAHEHGILHRDIKPSNILLRGDGEPQLSDFGLARDLSARKRLSIAGQRLGTPAYMPPEQARGEEVDRRSDVWSLGAVMYEMLTGRPLRKGRTEKEVLLAAVEGRVVPPRDVRPDVPWGLELVCLKCLMLYPNDRYQTAEALADDLARYLRRTEAGPSPGLGARPVKQRPVKKASEGGRLARGTRLGGYWIEDLLARGGMSEVYTGGQVALKRQVVLKVLSSEATADEELARRFRRETEALAMLNHPNIVSIYDCGEDRGRLFYSMEYVHGANLSQWVTMWGYSPLMRLGLVPQICLALEHAHLQKVIHRDLKPENILIGMFDIVKLADFGVARALRSHDRTKLVRRGREKRVVGTMAYMAPEQLAEPSRVDARADLFSLGVILYELLTGEMPTEGCDPPSRKAGISPAIDALVMQLLSKDPARRPPSAKAVRERIERILRAAHA